MEGRFCANQGALRDAMPRIVRAKQRCVAPNRVQSAFQNEGLYALDSQSLNPLPLRSPPEHRHPNSNQEGPHHLAAFFVEEKLTLTDDLVGEVEP